MPRTHLVLLPALLAALACASAEEAEPPLRDATAPGPDSRVRSADHEGTQPPRGPVEYTLPPDWPQLSPLAFERDVLAPLGAAAPVRLHAPDLASLGKGLDGAPQTAVRAAVLLGRCGDPRAPETLLARLERRVPAPARADDAGGAVAAAALALDPPGARASGAAARLAQLSSGAHPHPDLEVRVECASAALALGDDRPVPFLLQVLRIETPPGQADPRDFQVSATTAWARGRAAEALSTRAGVPCTWSPDAPMAERARGADALEAILADS